MLMLVLGGQPAQAQQTSEQRQIRALSPELHPLLDAGVEQSPELRRLADRLETSDVVVYLECESPVLQVLKAKPPARLVFLANAGGHRYVVVRLDCRMSEHRQLMMLAHELRHAGKIADAPAVIDSLSLRHLYERVGFLSKDTGEAMAFETRTAERAGTLVGRELRRAETASR